MRTQIAGLPEPRRGKVREVYDLGDKLLIVATDRISAFDVIMANGIPDKGRILNQMSAFWFGKLGHVCPHHVIAVDDEVIARVLPQPEPDLLGRTMLVRKAPTIPIECVARGYLAGSLYKEYRRDGGEVHGLSLPPGLLDGSKLPEPIFTPASKAEEGHDENLSFREMIDRVGQEVAGQLRDWTLELYGAAARHAETAGLILADTKFEFGVADDGIIWIDEALTPDSSRFWEASLWKPGGAQPSFDKQFLRDWLETSQWNKQPPGPALPDEITAKTREKYLEAFRRLTSRTLPS